MTVHVFVPMVSLASNPRAPVGNHTPHPTFHHHFIKVSNNLPKLLYFFPRLPRVLFRSPGLTPRIANSHDGNKACPRYFSRRN